MGNSIKKYIAIFLIVAMTFTTNGVGVFAASMGSILSAASDELAAESKEVGYYYEHYSSVFESHSYLLNDNTYDNYYFDSNGIMQVGIVSYNGQYHYMSEDPNNRGKEDLALTSAINQQ